MSQGVSHIALVCSDMDATVRFYCDVLGLPLVKTIELPDGMAPRPTGCKPSPDAADARRRPQACASVRSCRRPALFL